MAETLRGEEIAIKVGLHFMLEGVWVRIHKITNKDIVLRRLNEEQIARARRVKAKHDKEIRDAAAESGEQTEPPSDKIVGIEAEDMRKMRTDEESEEGPQGSLKKAKLL